MSSRGNPGFGNNGGIAVPMNVPLLQNAYDVQVIVAFRGVRAPNPQAAVQLCGGSVLIGAIGHMSARRVQTQVGIRDARPIPGDSPGIEVSGVSDSDAESAPQPAEPSATQPPPQPKLVHPDDE